jgi:hypothetical protein
MFLAYFEYIGVAIVFAGGGQAQDAEARQAAFREIQTEAETLLNLSAGRRYSVDRAPSRPGWLSQARLSV